MASKNAATGRRHHVALVDALNSFQRKGFAYKAAELAMKHVLNETDIDLLYAVYDSENRASEKIIQRLGFHFERSFQEGERTINVFRYNCSQSR